MSSHYFYPSIGGIETVSTILAHDFASLGHDLTVVTTTAENGPATFPFKVVRRPSAAELMRLVRACQVFFHNNISLQCAWPLIFVPRPWVVAHHTWITRPNGSVGAIDRFKRLSLKLAKSISVSRAIAAHLPVPSTIIANPYRDDVFTEIPAASREHELVFLGRLVSDKGADILIDAMHILKKSGSRPRLTIVGAGTDETALRARVAQLGMTEQIIFVGAKNGQELTELLNAHRIMVVPSRWKEPFGLVALEGIACGCAVIGSDARGLPAAIR